MRISDWSSDVCSSDLAVTVGIRTRATVDGDLSALRCAGALVQVGGHAVTIGIERATACIHLYASRGFRALVEIIGNAVAVHVDRTSVRIDMHAHRCAGAFVEAIGYAIAVAVFRAVAKGVAQAQADIV